MQIPRYYDVFPSKVDTDSIQRLEPTFPPRDFITYVPYLHAEKLKMYYYHVGYGRMVSNNMQRTLSAALSASTEWRTKFDWRHANVRLTIDWEAHNPDKRCDTRLSFCSGSTFLVKAFFTFGKREVNPEEVHVLQTTQAPLLFYLPRTERRSLVDSRPERSFRHEEVTFYDRYVLQPNSVYKIPGGTSYLLMTSVKSLFSLHRVTPELADGLESLWSVDYADPTAHTDYEGWRTEQPPPTDPYDKPPPSVMPLDHFVHPGASTSLPVAKRRKTREPVFKQPVWKEPPPVFKLLPEEPVTTSCPPVWNEFVLPEPPVWKELELPVLPEESLPPPVWKELELPVLPEESLPPVTVDPPVWKELELTVMPKESLPPVDPPVWKEPELPVLPEESLPPVTTSYVEDFFNAMPWTSYYQPTHESSRTTPHQTTPFYPTFDVHSLFDTTESFQPLFDTTESFQPTFQPESFQPLFDTTESFQPTFPPKVFQPTFQPESFEPTKVFQPEAFHSTFQPFDDSILIGDFLESLFSGLSESTLQQLDGDIEQYLRPEGVVGF